MVESLMYPPLYRKRVFLCTEKGTCIEKRKAAHCHVEVLPYAIGEYVADITFVA